MKKIYLFDWGDTIMKNFPDETGKMNTWQKIQPMQKTLKR
jgi:putative hydrolase of the HAD superfamily